MRGHPQPRSPHRPRRPLLSRHGAAANHLPMTGPTPPADDVGRLVEIVLDEDTIGRASREIEHERAVAIYDLIEQNSFRVPGRGGGPYALRLSVVDRRLVFAVTGPGGGEVVTHILSLTPFRRIVRDYFMICESYYAAIRTATPSQIEAIDMGRRGLHNEGSELLTARLDGKIEVDFETSRRLFTLISVLLWKGDGR